MKTRSESKAAKEGGILLVVMLIMLLLTFLSIGFLSLAQADALETAHRHNRARAFWMAEAGLNELKAIVTQELNRGPLEGYGLVGNDTAVLSRTVDGAGSYKVFVRRVDAADELDETTHYTVEAVGRSLGDDVEVVIHSSVRLATISEEVWMTHTEGNVDFTDGDKLYGPTKTNGKFNIRGTPKIYGRASTSSSGVNYSDGRSTTSADSDVFLAGLTFGVPQTDFNADLIDEIAAQSGMAPVEGPAAIEFLADGQYILSYDEVETKTVTETYWKSGYYTRVRRRWVWVSGSYQTRTSEQEIRTTIATTNHIDNIGLPGIEDNIIYVQGEVSVKGTVGGSVSVASDSTIKIIDDVVYASAPALSGGQPSVPIEEWADRDIVPNLDERLGLYAKEKVEIDFPDHRNRYDGRDVNIHASIFVTEPPSGNANWGFGAADRSSRLGYPYIHLYGSIVQYERGVIGYGSRNGFLKDYHHDERFIYAPAPGAPTTVPEFFSWSMEVR